MNPPGNSAGDKTPPSSQNQTLLQWPGQTHITANNESRIINEPSLPLHNAGGRRAPPPWPRRLGIHETRQPPLGANQESHIINQPFLPPHHATAGRRTPTSWPQRLGIEELRQTRLVANQESHIINQPFLPPHRAADGRGAPPSWPQRLGIEEHRQTPFITNQECHIINQQFLPPHRAADGRGAPPSWPQRLGIEEHRQTPFITNQECHIINQPFGPPHHHAASRRITPPSPSSQRQLGIQEPGNHCQALYFARRRTQTLRVQLLQLAKRDQLLQHQQHALRVNHESPTTPKPSPPLHAAGRRTVLQNLRDQLLELSKKDQLLQYQQQALRVNQESHTMKKPPSSSEDRRGGVGSLRCANCNSTSTTQWRSDPTGQMSLCNACGIRLNRGEETRAASGLQSSIIVLPPGTSSSAPLTGFWQEAPNRVQIMENNANPFVPENNFLGHSSGLQSSNIVSRPPEMSPPAAPSVANSVQLVENILLGDPSGLQSSSPLRDPAEVESKMDEFRRSLTDKTLDNSPGS